ncbi:MAG: MlaE family lipid ABC transporter permease subunit [Desulfuromonadales bacterium]
MQKQAAESAKMQVSVADDEVVLTFSGRLDVETTAELWRRSTALLEQHRPSLLRIEAGAVDYCDGAGIGLLVELCCRQHHRNGKYRLCDLAPQFRQMFDLFNPAALPTPSRPKAQPAHLPEEVGRGSWRVWEWLRDLVAFIGELTVATLDTLRRPGRIRWRDSLLIAEKAGVNALPIVLLVSFLVGLILAFQAAIPMRQFGAEIYVADLIGLSMLRELGPLMTAMVMAGRSGSAFAAELGTMKVNEELDALQTMGLDPVRFLVVNRVLTAMVMIPLLTVFADLLGVIGGGVVLLSLGYSLVTYVNQLLGAVTWADMAGGLFKSIFFGLIVAALGCLHGLQTKSGASAVGDSATRAVVSGNILIIVADGIFSVIFYYLGI